MLKEWVWWQIEASLEQLEEDSTVPLSDLTIYFWMALAVKGCVGWQEKSECMGLGRNPFCSPWEIRSCARVFTTAM